MFGTGQFDILAPWKAECKKARAKKSTNWKQKTQQTIRLDSTSTQQVQLQESSWITIAEKNKEKSETKTETEKCKNWRAEKENRQT